MKVAKIVAILCCLFSLILFKVNAVTTSFDAQCLSAEKQWAVWHYININMPYYTVTYGFCGDSVIDEKVYKKIWSSKREDFSDASLEDFFIREVDGKIYMRWSEGEEWLFFDCSCEVGDTLLLTQGSDCPEIYMYAAIESVQDTIFENIGGEKCNYWRMNLFMRDAATNEPCFFLGEELFFENIGFSCYGYSPTKFGATGGGQNLLCMHEGDSLIYMSNEGTCYKSNETDIETTSSDEVSFTQQGSECVVTLPADVAAWEATLSNSVGVTVARRSGEGSEIILPATSKGTHILVIKADGRVVKKKVFIK